MLVSKALWLLGLLQLLDAPEVTLTTSAFSWVLWKVSCLVTAQAVPSEANDPPHQLVSSHGNGQGKSLSDQDPDTQISLILRKNHPFQKGLVHPEPEWYIPPIFIACLFPGRRLHVLWSIESFLQAHDVSAITSERLSKVPTSTVLVMAELACDPDHLTPHGMCFAPNNWISHFYTLS